MIISEVRLDRARFGRRKFVAGVGAALTSAAGALWFPERASAACPWAGCYGYDMCPSCSGTQCTASGCYAGVFGCPTGVQCWGACPNGGPNQYKCCDWGLPGFVSTCGHPDGFCICRGYMGSC